MHRAISTAIAATISLLCPHLMGTVSAQTLLQTTAGNYLGSRYGSQISLVGDLNQDGHDDYAVCAQGVPPFLGADPNAYVGVRSGLDGSKIHELHGPVQFQLFAVSVTGPGDLNLDGIPDVVVGATPAPLWRRGSAIPFSGMTGSVLSLTPGMAPSNGFGAAVSAAGDVNADGLPDFAVGAPGHSTGAPDGGAAFVFTVPPGGNVSVLLRSYIGTVPNAGFGARVASPGDVDGDGSMDLAVASPNSVPFVDVFSGATGSLIHHISTPCITLSALGDIDGDTVGDIGVGSPLGQYAACYSGASGLLLQMNLLAGSSAFGTSITGVGDITGDGRGDYAIGDRGTAFSQGSIQVRSGFDGSLLHTLVPPSTLTLEQFGSSLAGGSDLNGDGKLDLVVGEPTSLITPTATLGHAYVISLQ